MGLIDRLITKLRSSWVILLIGVILAPLTIVGGIMLLVTSILTWNIDHLYLSTLLLTIGGITIFSIIELY